MSVCILKSCEIRHNATLLKLSPGEYLTLSDPQEGKLVSAALARPVTPEDYKSVIAGFGTKKPRDGWDAAKRRHPEQWHLHVKALRSGDLEIMTKTFNAMLV